MTKREELQALLKKVSRYVTNWESNGIPFHLDTYEKDLARIKELVKEMSDAINSAWTLIDKLEMIEKDPKYQQVWTSAHIHGVRYDGPQYDEDLQELKDKMQGWKD